MSARPKILLAAGLAVALAAALCFRLVSRRDDTPPSAAAPARASAPGLRPPALPMPSPLSLSDRIRELLGKLQRGQRDAADLEALRQLLLTANPSEAIAAITAFLQTGDDASTGQSFGVGPDGRLAGAPTLRVFLMDLLGQLAKAAGSDRAGALAHQVLETKTTPDEWAVSLRNVAWSDPGATGYLAAKMREMLAEPTWTASPSGALLESFDVIVFSGDPTFIPTLSDLSRDGSPQMQRAALIALDRLSETAPLAVMTYLNNNPDTVADRPFLRADYFAKADLRQPEQQAAVEAYLSRPDVGDAEKTKLIKELATASSFVGDTLLTPPATPDDGVARQQTAATVLQRWIDANRFPTLLVPMQQVLARIKP